MIVQEIRKKKTRKRNWCDRVIFEIFMIGCVFFLLLFCFLFCCYSLRLPVKILLGNLIWVSLFVSYKGNYVACLIAMLQLMDEKHYQKYVAHFPTDQELLVSFNSWKLLSFELHLNVWSVIALICIVLKFFLRKMLVTFVLNEGASWFGMKGGGRG